MFTHSLRRTAAIAAAVAATIAAGLATPASAHPTTSGQIQAELSAARQYSAPFHTTDLAAAGGWQKLPLPCFDNPGTGDNNGGMGNHWILDPATLGNAPVAGEPNILVFDPVTNKLVAVEYVELQSAASAAPTLFGQTFEPSNASRRHADLRAARLRVEAEPERHVPRVQPGRAPVSHRVTP